jgi:hypothetical protein
MDLTGDSGHGRSSLVVRSQAEIYWRNGMARGVSEMLVDAGVFEPDA